MARTCEFLVPARVLTAAAEAARTAIGRFDDLRIAVFTHRAPAAVLRLDLVLVMGALTRFARHHLSHHLGPTQANHLAGLEPTAPQALPVHTAMLTLQRNASPF